MRRELYDLNNPNKKRRLSGLSAQVLIQCFSHCPGWKAPLLFQVESSTPSPAVAALCWARSPRHVVP